MMASRTSRTLSSVSMAEAANLRSCLHCRISSTDDDHFAPTRKGLTISPARWPDFVEAVFELDRRLRAEGLVEPERESNGSDAS